MDINFGIMEMGRSTSNACFYSKYVHAVENKKKTLFVKHFKTLQSATCSSMKSNIWSYINSNMHALNFKVWPKIMGVRSRKTYPIKMNKLPDKLVV